MLALNAVRTDAPHIDKSAFLPPEQQLYADITGACKQHRTAILDSVLRQTAPATPEATHEAEPAPARPQTPPVKERSEQQPATPEPAKDGTTVTFTKAVPRFSGGEDQVFGPYSPGDTATLPERIAQVLVKKGRAEQA